MTYEQANEIIRILGNISKALWLFVSIFGFVGLFGIRITKR
jgi:hypothetical protein